MRIWEKNKTTSLAIKHERGVKKYVFMGWINPLNSRVNAVACSVIHKLMTAFLELRWICNVIFLRISLMSYNVEIKSQTILIRSIVFSVHTGKEDMSFLVQLQC